MRYVPRTDEIAKLIRPFALMITDELKEMTFFNAHANCTVLGWEFSPDAEVALAALRDDILQNYAVDIKQGNRTIKNFVMTRRETAETIINFIITGHTETIQAVHADKSLSWTSRMRKYIWLASENNKIRDSIGSNPLARINPFHQPHYADLVKKKDYIAIIHQLKVTATTVPFISDAKYSRNARLRQYHLAWHNSSHRHALEKFWMLGVNYQPATEELPETLAETNTDVSDYIRYRDSLKD